MVIDYSLFGDVVTFDTTFCTNKENRPFGIFSGFNHHRGIVIFGATLLYDEMAESFKWLFEAFLESHGQKKPITLFTDQDAAMAKAISEVFTGTWHDLCTWHLMQNGIRHLGNLMKDGSSFLSDLKMCIYQYDEEVQFEAAWEQLRSNYQFLKHFERVVNDKRANELKAESEARNKLPRNSFPHTPLMGHAEKVYTPLIFRLFHDEFSWVGSCYIKRKDESNSLHKYDVGIHGSEEEFKVECHPSEVIVKCSCRKFETFSILCCHALKIFVRLDIMSIPEAYVLSRWTCATRNLVVEDSNGIQIEEDVNLDSTERYRILCRKLVNIASEASNSVEGYALVNNVASDLYKQLHNLHSGNSNPSPDESTEEPNLNIVKGLKKKEKKKIEGSKTNKRLKP
ncbi:protein FAR1-RELATED SEQUENCE 5-like [Telopea speciosissima]|uniref:protein FAR1-RELATED SEQUENCE 5-like n=1 Tax=Telopea speciosissima TaxID=54955 RepID=UPI001CC57F19|nr:protein FAR1-RELATED SEQUENCE 5-like [Telopea speciosissima]